MCGIAGYYGFKDDKLIKKFSKDLEHRGPDGAGFYHHDNVSLLSRRLAIIDVKGGDQPIYNEDKTVAIVYNGEVYNYAELMADLKAKGHVFRTKSDTEVMLHGYEEEGIAFFDRCNGMFGLAIHDQKRHQLIVVRDQFGIKPIYYTVTPDDREVMFSSEIKPLINSGRIAKKPNDRILYRYLKYRVHDDDRETFFTDVHRLMPGEALIVSKQGIEIKKYSHLQESLLKVAKNPAPKYDVETMKELLEDAVRLRLISEVPVGSCLSGGLDSSSVVAIIERLLKHKVKEAGSVGKTQNTFSAVFPGSTNDEERYIDDLLNTTPTVTSHKIYPRPEEFFETIHDFVRTQEEPTISTGPYAQYKVMEEVGKHVTVVIDGQGADEMMAGYIPYYFVYLKQLRRTGQYGTLLRETLSSFDVIGKFVKMRVQAKLGRRRSADIGPLLNQEYAARHAGERMSVISDDLKGRLAQDIFSNSLQSLLRYEDRNSMRFSVEGRVPFLDFRLMKFIFSQPDEAIIKNGWNKRILRDAMRDTLPVSIADRRNKIGFTNPEHEWFMRMKNRIYAIFLSESFGRRPYFNQEKVIKAFQEFVEGKTDDTLVFWRLLNVELWLRIFFDEEPMPSAARHTVDLTDYTPNSGKSLTITVGKHEYRRHPIRTELFKKDDAYVPLIADYVKGYLGAAKTKKSQKWMLVISEKVIAIAQGRSYFIWDLKPGRLARFLSQHVRKTPFGIGLGSPWTMQLALDEVGPARMLIASAAAAVTKPLGLKGVFYHIAGRDIGGIDGPTEYSVYPSNVSAKLLPKDPQKVCRDIHDYITDHLPPDQTNGFAGVVIIDANDLGRRVIGNSTHIKTAAAEDIFADNPMGQSDEQTPLIVVDWD